MIRLRICLLSPEHILEKEIPILKERFHQLTLDFLFYSSIFKIPELLSGKQMNYDALFFLGRTTLNYVASKLTPTIPWYVIPRNNASIVQLLFSLSLTSHNIYEIITDAPKKELDIIYDSYRQANIDPSKLKIISAPKYEFNELLYDNLITYYKQCQKQYDNYTCITIYSDVYQYLKKKNFPIIFSCASLADISNTIEKAHSAFLLQASRESQIVIIHIAIDEPNLYSPIANDEYQMAIENLNVAKCIYSFARKIQGALFPIKDTEYLLFSTRSIIEHQTNKFKDFSLIDIVKKKTAKTISMGIGLGKTALEAKKNARTGIKKAQKNGGNQIFLVYDENTIRGPYPTIRESPSPIICERFSTLSRETGISSFTLSQIHKLLTEKDSHECTVSELSDYLHISTRAVNRIILKLLDTNHCYEVGKKYHHKAGRPSRILQFDF